MLLTLVSVIAFAQLEAAEIRITVQARSARVEAAYRLSEQPGGARFAIMRVPARELDMQSVAGGTASWQELPALYRLTVHERRPSGLITLRYVVRGPPTRIPLFVPEAPTDPTRSSIRIRVDGVDGAVALAGGFPRLVREASGTLLAQPENMPSFVRVPQPGRLSVVRVADAAVIALLVVASVLWFRRARRRGWVGRSHPI